MAGDPLSGRVALGVRSFLALLLGVVGFFYSWASCAWA